MKVIVGLGNPGKNYEKTRHNVGFLVLDELKKTLELPDFKEEKKFKSAISLNKKVVLLKPLTFMNNSGEAVLSFLNYYKLKPEDLIVVHDDIDLKLGSAKINFGQGAAGHKGVLSIISCLGTNNFWRARVGILTSPEKEETEKFVLANFSKEEIAIIKEVIKNIVCKIENSLDKGYLKTTLTIEDSNLTNKKDES